MEKILVSACLLGENVKYNGGNNYTPLIEELKKYYDIIPFCPEVGGGLPTPRTPAERMNNRVFTKDGKDVTKNYQKGAYKALEICKYFGIKKVLLKERSPSCSKYFIYDGTFLNRLVKGKGITAELLSLSGIEVYNEDEITMLFKNNKSLEN